MLLAAHGGATGQTWELWFGILLIVVGAVFLIMKIIRRNAAQAQP
jgi:cytochrome c-type biogenesis protein CcmH/NrfF